MSSDGETVVATETLLNRSRLGKMGKYLTQLSDHGIKVMIVSKQGTRTL